MLSYFLISSNPTFTVKPITRDNVHKIFSNYYSEFLNDTSVLHLPISLSWILGFKRSKMFFPFDHLNFLAFISYSCCTVCFCSACLELWFFRKQCSMWAIQQKLAAGNTKPSRLGVSTSWRVLEVPCTACYKVWSMTSEKNEIDVCCSGFRKWIFIHQFKALSSQSG